MARTWAFQQQLDLLVQSGFAEVDQKSTDWWAAYNAENKTAYELPLYNWTTKGQYACWRYKNSTPMSWAEAIASGTKRHCIGCGCDTTRKKVWAQDGTKRTVCMACAPKYEAGEIRLKAATA